ncbi:hypothetical protein AK812_SmicGene9438 [Symbiodinium microadriaticum]|uniref:Uncharacterized protein n=1 Tax=Symbiodinium microadriaticum TaxID=2951 RepID=A0A1Q9EID7_SYMMI|nr:hypothetical protein AK812_SmicGene9438 [Symbiodinium microadriaticum]
MVADVFIIMMAIIIVVIVSEFTAVIALNAVLGTCEVCRLLAAGTWRLEPQLVTCAIGACAGAGHWAAGLALLRRMMMDRRCLIDEDVAPDCAAYGLRAEWCHIILSPG